AARFAVEHDLVPELSSPYARSRANEVRILVEVMDRRRRFGPALAAAEREEQGALLGRRPKSVAQGWRALERAIAAHSLGDEAIIRHLTRRHWSRAARPT